MNLSDILFTLITVIEMKDLADVGLICSPPNIEAADFSQLSLYKFLLNFVMAFKSKDLPFFMLGP